MQTYFSSPVYQICSTAETRAELPGCILPWVTNTDAFKKRPDMKFIPGLYYGGIAAVVI